MKKKKSYLLLLMFSLFLNAVFAQKPLLISGVITDEVTRLPLPFATVSLKSLLIGTSANEHGQFELYIPEGAVKDTIQVTYLGYKHKLIPLDTSAEVYQISLVPSAVSLKEVVIRPLPPTYYIKMAMQRIKENYPQKPFQTEAYYREVLMENESFIKSDEGIFRSYFENFLDTAESQHQLLLYRRANDIKEIAFMKEQTKRKQEKAIKKGDTTAINDQINFTGVFGGPKMVLEIAKFSKSGDSYLDSNNFNDYNYSFGPSSAYDNQELIRIDFASKGNVNHARSSGTVYINLNSFAIVKTELAATLKLSIIKKAALNVLLGVSIDNPEIRARVEYQLISGLWYPQNVFINVDLHVSKNHWFSPDENAAFKIEEIFTANKIKVSDVSAIPLLKRYDSSKEMAVQEFNDDKLTWEGINIIKK